MAGEGFVKRGRLKHGKRFEHRRVFPEWMPKVRALHRNSGMLLYKCNLIHHRRHGRNAVMKRIILLFLMMLAAVWVFAEAESVYDRQTLAEMSVEELYELEDAIVGALMDVFAKESYESSAGDVFGPYVINKRTRKFHYPYCYSALQIGEEREFVTCTASELVEKKYEPCGQCKPYSGWKEKP